jgi:lysophospholipase L1-like esterase
MDDNDNEGHSGFTISQIAGFRDAYRQRPNVVLLHAGTNDMGKPEDPDNAPGRLDNLVGTLVAALPDATVIVARIIPAASSSTQSRIRVYNNAITKLMASRALRGEKVMVVDMPSGVQTTDLADGLHPNAQGYQNMAIKWAIALTGVDSLGWIKEPVTGEIPGQPSRDYCPRDPSWLPQGEVASGGGLGTNLWYQNLCWPL